MHTVIWIDHKEARIFRVHPETAGHVRPLPIDETTVHAPTHHIHRHPKGQGEAREHPEDAKRFFHEVAQSLSGADPILIAGPSSAKLEFFRYVREHEHRLEPKVVGIETLDHLTDGEIVAFARKCFARSDRMGR